MKLTIQNQAFQNLKVGSAFMLKNCHELRIKISESSYVHYSFTGDFKVNSIEEVPWVNDQLLPIMIVAITVKEIL